MSRERTGATLLSLDHAGIRYPEDALKNELAQYPAGTVVALPTPEQLHNGSSHQLILDSTQDYASDRIFAYEYWKDIVEHSRKLGHKIIFVADLLAESQAVADGRDFDTEYAKLRKFKEGATRIFIPSEIPHYPASLLAERQLKESAEIRSALYSWNYTWGRAEAMRKALAESGAQVVVLADHHAYALQDNMGDGPDILYARIKSRKRETDAFTDGKLEIMADVRREIARRQVLAATEWRVTNGRPDGIGTWDMGCRSRGLFEIYIEKQDKKGRFEAKSECVLGTASIKGRKTGKILEFEKTYDKEKSLGSRKPYKLKYTGVSFGFGYEGVWHTEDNWGKFIYFEGPKFLHTHF